MIRDAGFGDLIGELAGELGIDDVFVSLGFIRDDVRRIVVTTRHDANVLDVVGLVLILEVGPERGRSTRKVVFLAASVGEHRVDAHKHEDQDGPDQDGLVGLAHELSAA